MDTDERTENEKILDAINAALLNRATSDQNGYMIGTRRLDRIPLEELRRLRGTFVTAVRFERGEGVRLSPRENMNLHNIFNNLAKRFEPPPASHTSIRRGTQQSRESTTPLSI